MIEAILKIENDIRVNERCLQEELNPDIKKMLNLWLKYDSELLELLKEKE